MATQLNVKQAYAMFNKQKVAASYNAEEDIWTVEIQAPAESSWSQPDHVYLMELYAEDMAGNVGKLDSTDKTYGNQLKIRVLEKTLPIATITYPASGSVIGKNSIDIQLKLQDSGGSGLNLDSVEFKVNNEVKTIGSWTDSDGAKTATYTVTSLSDGGNTITLKVTDNDGNESTVNTVNFIVSTAAPTLDVTAPIDNLVTNGKTVDVKGTTTPGSYVSIESLTVNGNDVEIDPEGGAFTYTLTLDEGENDITIIVTDNAGNTTTVHRKVILDTKAPVITDVKAVSTVVDASGTIKVTFKVSEAQ